MTLDQIAVILREKSFLLQDPGLLSGQAGIAVFFFHFARHTGQSKYEDLGSELLESLQNKLAIYTPVSYSEGVAGIGAGIEHLIQHHFLNADGNEIFSEFDLRVFQELIYRQNKEINLCTGVGGWLRYFYFRIKEYQGREEPLETLINKDHLLHIIDYFYEIRNKDSIDSYEILSILYDLYELKLFPAKLEKLMCFYLGKNKTEAKEDETERLQLLQEVHTMKQKREEKILNHLRETSSANNYGLMGLAGTGLSLLSEIDPSHRCFIDLL